MKTSNNLEQKNSSKTSDIKKTEEVPFKMLKQEILFTESVICGSLTINIVFSFVVPKGPKQV